MTRSNIYFLRNLLRRIFLLNFVAIIALFKQIFHDEHVGFCKILA